ncbi:MAG: YceI family protein [Bacteroidetes bacterium]|jgi:hypothetical protein|nr:YceI family protein [Bacteroidota bacterium]
MRNCLIIVFLFTCISVTAQKSYTKNGTIGFYSKAPLEKITAENNQVMSTMDMQSGQVQFSVLIKAFHFKKSLMEEHFNENYMESSKFPKATFRGFLQQPIPDLSKDGQYTVMISGDLTLHGVTKNISTPASIEVTNGIATGKSTFNITLADYKISIPKIVKDNISETVDITVNCRYDKKM